MTISSKMKLKSFLSDTKMWFFFTTVNLALWHGVLNHRIENNQSLITSFFILVALFLFWKKREDIIVSPHPLTSLIGFLILAWIVLRGISVFWFEFRFIQFLPLISFISLISIISRWRFSPFFRPFLALLFLSLVGVINKLIGILSLSEWTAQVSAFLLHYLGFNVVHENVFIHLNNGSVEVLPPCTGGPLISLLFNLTLGLVLVIPLSWHLLSKFLFGIFGIGFFLGVIRVALLAVVVSNEATFDYWHGDQGNQIFSLIAFSIWIVGAHLIYENYGNNWDTPYFPSSDQKISSQEDKDYSSQKEEEFVTNFSLTSPRSWLLPIAAMVIASATVITILIPQIGRREIPSLQFPSQISLSDWKQANSFPLVTNPETELVFHRLRSGREYHYRKEQAQVDVALRFVSPTYDGRVKTFIEKAYSESLKEAYQQGNTSYFPNLGHYRLFKDKEKAYLSACLTPIFESTVDNGQYSNLSNEHFFNPKTLIPRLLGQQSFRERRCLWVNLSTPLNPDSPETSYQILESVFKAGYPEWQGLFENQ